MSADKPHVAPLPPALTSKNPLGWLVVFGPGAIIASITLGSGELIFSTRGGSLFGYPILFTFVLISVLKWGLVFSMSRHMVLSGVHPYERMMDLPGPRGWFPLMLLLIATVTTPVWTSFFPGILGNFTSWVTGTQSWLNGAIDYVWGAGFLIVAVLLTLTSGYTVLERVQMAIVAVMMICATVTLVLYQPDLLAMLQGAFVPQPLEYPEWLPTKYPAISEASVWVETTRYVGVIGGAGFDYLAYTAWLREKHWGRASIGRASNEQLREIADDPQHPVRYWARAPLVDCASSFVLVVAFSAVFVASGVVVLGPQREIPTEDNFLDLQAKFVTGIHPWLLPIYVTGAYLTIFGTLYGTYEIGVAVCREIVRAMAPDFAARNWTRLRRLTIAWLTIGATGLLAWSFFFTLRGQTLDEVRAPAFTDDMVGVVTQWKSEAGAPIAAGDVLCVLRTPEGEVDIMWEPDGGGVGRVFDVAVTTQQEVGAGDLLAVVGGKAKPRILLAILTPANLFTGVLSVGVFCLLMPWMDWKFLPRQLHMPWPLVVLNVVSAMIFLYLGWRGYWDHSSRWFAITGLLGTVLLAIVIAALAAKRQRGAVKG